MYYLQNDGSSGESDFISDSESVILIMMVLCSVPCFCDGCSFAPFYILFVIDVGFGNISLMRMSQIIR